ncbi:MAG: hypothetical protein NTZ97_03500 [Candidatus Moranbacteria bacterium]|nr:hypothetical protein [Candidatus Moranbacteria bacterium]
MVKEQGQTAGNGFGVSGDKKRVEKFVKRSKENLSSITRSKLIDEKAVAEEIDRLDKIEKDNAQMVEYSEENGFYFSDKAKEEYAKSLGVDQEAIDKCNAFEERINEIIDEKRKNDESFDKMQLVLNELKEESPRLHAILTEELEVQKKEGQKKSEEFAKAKDAIETVKKSKLGRLIEDEVPENFGKVSIDKNAYLDAEGETTLYKKSDLKPGEEELLEKIKEAANRKLGAEFNNQEIKKTKEANEKIVDDLRAKYPGERAKGEKIIYENPQGNRIILNEFDDNGLIYYNLKKKGARGFTEERMAVYELDGFMQENEFKPIPKAEVVQPIAAEKPLENTDTAKVEKEPEFTPEELIEIEKLKGIINPTLKIADEFDYSDSGYSPEDIPAAKKAEKNRVWNNFKKEILDRKIFADEEKTSKIIAYLKNQLKK